jgi:maltooligosyltrehalose synthase
MGAEATTPPLGRDVWGDTQLVLPANWRPHRWRDLLTDQVFNAVATPEGGALDMADLFQILPLALLVADSPAEEPLESA